MFDRARPRHEIEQLTVAPDVPDIASIRREPDPLSPLWEDSLSRFRPTAPPWVGADLTEDAYLLPVSAAVRPLLDVPNVDEPAADAAMWSPGDQDVPDLAADVDVLDRLTPGAETFEPAPVAPEDHEVADHRRPPVERPEDTAAKDRIEPAAEADRRHERLEMAPVAVETPVRPAVRDVVDVPAAEDVRIFEILRWRRDECLDRPDLDVESRPSRQYPIEKAGGRRADRIRPEYHTVTLQASTHAHGRIVTGGLGLMFPPHTGARQELHDRGGGQSM